MKDSLHLFLHCAPLTCRIGVLLALSGVWMATAQQAGSDSCSWPEFRGPTGEGHVPSSMARKLPLQWSPRENVVWKTVVPGGGWSSPVICQGRVFLTTAVENADGQLSLRAMAFEADSGEAAWTKEVFSYNKGGTPRIHRKNTQASPTPITDGEKLYVHFGHLGTAALDLSGNILWRNNNLGYSPVHGNGGSPILVDEKLIFSADGSSDPFIVALNKNSGAVLWKVPRRTSASRTFSFSTPLLIEVNGVRQVISPGSNVVVAYDPNNGREIWRVRYEGYSVVPRPVYGQGLVFISTSFDNPEVIAIRPTGTGDITETHIAWRSRRGAPNTPSMLLAGQELYMVSDGGVASCVDAKSGRHIWQQRLEGDYSASPILAGNRIYFTSEEGKVTVMEAATTTNILAVNDMEERALASPAAADGGLFIRTENHLYRVEE